MQSDRVLSVLAVGLAGLIGACQVNSQAPPAAVPAAAPAQARVAAGAQPVANAAAPSRPNPPVQSRVEPVPTDMALPIATAVTPATQTPSPVPPTPTTTPVPPAQPAANAPSSAQPAANAPSSAQPATNVPSSGQPVVQPALNATGPAPDCQFVLGFAEMRDAIGPDRIGACLEEVRQIPGNGNTEQRTSNGLLLYRAIDGRVVFTDKSSAWILGPEGLSERPATARLPFEGDRQVIESLRQGGYTIYFRHATTDKSQQDTDPNNLANCATQRNLSDKGRDQARQMGEAFRALNIPVGRVLSSGYCRALDHARLTFGWAEAEPSLVLPDPLSQAEREQNTGVLKRILAAQPAPGTNTVLVSHSPNIKSAAGVDLPAEGGAVILKPDPSGKPAVIARLLPEEWPALAAALAAR